MKDNITTNVDYLSMFRTKFRKVEREMEYIKVKIDKKQGFLFFKTHAFSIDELLNSEHHKKIYSITGKIGDDVNNWYKAGNLSEEGKKAYYDERENIEEDLHEINLLIENREPTWWEDFSESLKNFVHKIMRNMPYLTRTLLGKIASSIGLPAPVTTMLLTIIE